MSGERQSSGRPRRTLLARVFPHLPEPIAPEVYRQIGRVRAYIIAACLLLNATSYASADALRIDLDYWLPMQVPNNLALLASLLLGLWCWKGKLSHLGLRRATQVAIAAELVSLLINLSLYGSVNSHMLFVAVLLVITYRIAYDFAIGASATGILFVGIWLLVIAEMTGLATPQGAIEGPLDAVYQEPGRQLIAAQFITLLSVLAFWGTNWVVLRVRNHEHAIRILRATLAAREGGDVGRYTGRTLKDTYVVGSRVGSGGMGEVYRGTHRRTQREVAIKLVHPHLIEDPMLMARFRREAEIVGSLGSKHIVEIIDVDEDEDQPFMVLEWLEGDNLAELVERDGPLSLKTAADVIDQVASALAAAHDVGVIHRDLKPENIILTEGENGTHATLVDFGVSKIINNATAITRDAAILGTPQFMSPEQASGMLDDVDPRADIFGLAAVTYYALSGHHPFVASSIPALLAVICGEEPPAISTIRPELGPHADQIEAVLAIAMAKRRDQRYASATAFAADLRNALEGALAPETIERAAKIERGAPSRQTQRDYSRMATSDPTIDVIRSNG